MAPVRRENTRHRMHNKRLKERPKERPNQTQWHM